LSNFKSGLDYFSFDIDFFNDEKIEFIYAKFGIEGEITTVKLLCKIYRNGYYLKWDEDKCLLFSKKVGENISIELINNVINELLKREFFNKKIFKKYQVLTSHGIQKRYFEAIKRRKKIVVYKEYFLLNNNNADIIFDNVDIISLNADISEQSKVKKSKEENTKEDKKREGVPYQKIMYKYNSICKSLKKVELLTENRKTAIRLRYKKYGIDKLIEIFNLAEKSDFLKGNNDRGWVANFDFVINENKIAKILEGNYDNERYKTDISKKYRTI